MTETPTFHDVLRARSIVDKHLSRTPLRHYPMLDNILEASVYVKHENFQPTGAFKIRGGINLISNLPPELKERGVVTASTGNHGQSIAYAAELFGVKATVVMPEGANVVKAEAIRSYGADIIFFGRDFDDAKAHCEELASQRGWRYISSGDEPLLVAGVATYTLEILEERPEIETIIVPIGGGSGASGACLVAKNINPRVEVIGVQSELAPAAYRTWKSRRFEEATMETEAEGLATRAPFMLPQRILWEWLDDFVLVSDNELRQAVCLYLEKAKTLAELAGAAPLAAALKLGDRLQGKQIVLILSGGNISPAKLRQCLS